LATSPEFKAAFRAVPAPTHTSKEIVVLATEQSLVLTPDSKPYPILAIIDGRGRLVKSMCAWLRYLRKKVGLSLSPSTPSQYARMLSYLARWIETYPPYPNLDIDGNIRLFTRSDLIAWLDYMMSEEGLGDKSLHLREACVKQFFTWLCTLEGGNIRSLEKSPWGPEDILGYITSSPSPLSPKFIPDDVIVTLLNGLHNECERCMFHAQFDMGLRISELVNFKLKDLPRLDEYDSSYAFIPVSVAGNKGRAGRSKPRVTLISRAVLHRIKRYHSSLDYRTASDWSLSDPDKPVFLTTNGKQWSSRNASKQFKKAVRRQGLDDRFCTHWMRHGTAFSILRSDFGKTYEDRMLTAQQVLGHSRLTTTEIYTQISPAMLERLTDEGRRVDRLEEAEKIRSATFLGSNQHLERRGHRG